VLARLVSGISFPSRTSEEQILEKEAGEVAQALSIVNDAFGQGVGIERALMNKGWNVERSMMCPHQDGKQDGKAGWRIPSIDNKLEDSEKRE
jgi:hypothetical protein